MADDDQTTDDQLSDDHTVPKGQIPGQAGQPLPGMSNDPFKSSQPPPQPSSGDEEEEEEKPTVAQLLVYTGTTSSTLTELDLVLKFTQGEETKAWQHVSTFLDSGQEVDESTFDEDDCIPFSDYYKRCRAEEGVLTNWDIKGVFDLRAGTGRMIGTKPLWERRFRVPEYYGPLFKVFLNDLGDDLEYKTDTLGSKGIIIRGATIEYGVLAIRFKIISGPDQERLSNKYEACFAALDQVALEILPNYGVAKDIT